MKWFQADEEAELLLPLHESVSREGCMIGQLTESNMKDIIYDKRVLYRFS
jgi:hypothetical protein